MLHRWQRSKHSSRKQQQVSSALLLPCSHSMCVTHQRGVSIACAFQPTNVTHSSHSSNPTDCYVGAELPTMMAHPMPGMCASICEQYLV
jgi:hypothetical protein